jgi:hypothetical protein
LPLKVAIKTERTSDDYHVPLIPCVKLKLSFIENAIYLVPSKMQLLKHLGLVLGGGGKQKQQKQHGWTWKCFKVCFYHIHPFSRKFLKPNNMERKAILGTGMFLSLIEMN